MYCPHCGLQVDDGVNFCPGCGQGLVDSAPNSTTAGKDEAGAETQLEEYRVWLLILVTIVTMGIYTPVWFLTQRRALNGLRAEEKLGAGVFLLVLVLYSINAASDSPGLPIGWDVIPGFLGLAAWAISLIQSFKARRIIRAHWRVPLSGAATFFFQYLYLQYKINRLLEWRRAGG